MRPGFGPLLDEQTLNALVESAFREAVNEHDLRPVGGASVSKIQYEPDRQVTFELELEVMPELELTRVGGFKLQREVQETTQAEEDEILERIRNEHGGVGARSKREACNRGATGFARNSPTGR